MCRIVVCGSTLTAPLSQTLRTCQPITFPIAYAIRIDKFAFLKDVSGSKFVSLQHRSGQRGNGMKKAILASLVLLASLAHATSQQPAKGGEGGNGYGGDGYGIGVGVGIAGAESNASAKASAESNANAAAIQGQIQAQHQAQTATGGDSKSTAYGGKGGSANAAGGEGGSSNATGGVSNAAGGTSNATGGSSGGNSINVQGSTYEQAASTAYAPDGKAPRTSCRLFIGIGGSQTGGSLSGGIPIGNDQTCMSGAQIEAMDKANKVQAGTFLIGDYLLAICKMEGMDQTQGCKK